MSLAWSRRGWTTRCWYSAAKAGSVLALASSAAITQAIERGEIPAETKVEAAIDLIYGPLYHRLLIGHAPLDDQFVDDIVDLALHGILPPA